MVRIPSSSAQMGGASPRVSEILEEAMTNKAWGRGAVDPTLDDAVSVLENFLANNAQNATLPRLRTRLQRAIDELALATIADAGDANPRGMEVLLKGELQAEDATRGVSADELMNAIALGTPGGNAREINNLAKTILNTGDADTAPDFKQMGDIAEALADLRARVLSNSGGYEYRTAADIAGVQDPDSLDLSTQLDSLIAALQANNAHRMEGPQTAGFFRSADDRAARNRGAYWDDQLGDLMPGDGSDYSHGQDPLLEAVAYLKKAGVPDDEIVTFLMSAIEEFDSGLQGSTLAGEFSGGAIQDELGTTPRPGGTSTPDENLIMSALGIEPMRKKRGLFGL